MRIMLPLSTPGIVVTAILGFIFPWNGRDFGAGHPAVDCPGLTMGTVKGQAGYLAREGGVGEVFFERTSVRSVPDP